MPNTVPEDYLHVVAGVILDPDDDMRVLLSRRHQQSHQGGKWEFPGGKVEAGENAEDALRRELHEELGISVRQARPFIRINHAYPDKAVHLDVWKITEYADIPVGREGQEIRWVNMEQLQEYEYPSANLPIIRALQLPAIYAISAAKRLGQDVFIARLELALKDGLKLLQLREPGMEQTRYRELARMVIEKCHKSGARVILNNDIALVEELAADGLQLNSKRLMQLQTRPVADDKLVIASCHNAGELQQATAIAADAALLSPVMDTPSHPGAVTLGWSRFAELARHVAIPVYALGGMEPGSLQLARKHGAAGIAMITSFWDQYRN